MDEIEICVWGVKAKTSRDAFDSWEVMAALYDMANGDCTKMVELMRALFGDQVPRIVDGIRAAKGDSRVPTVSGWLKDAMDEIARKAMGEAKN